MRLQSGKLALCALVLSVLAGCASGPSIRVDGDPSVDFGAYRSFGFFEPLATDKAGYSTLLTARLKDAARREMQAKGYSYDEANPQLRLNFNVNLVDKTGGPHFPQRQRRLWLLRLPRWHVRRLGRLPVRRRDYQLQAGHAHHRRGGRGAQGAGLAGCRRGRITQKVRENPAGAVDAAVTQILAGFPARGDVALAPATK
ncbi:MAG: DUF4136 domain-containing protein [Rhodocyclaceae bacterium]|nr:DUF4136 domain-containing protein [Rhodocyclaceae bacterium]